MEKEAAAAEITVPAIRAFPPVAASRFGKKCASPDL